MAGTKAPHSFVARLKKALDEQPDGLSLRQVAGRAGLSPAYLSLLANGERGVPSNDAIASLERVLNLEAGELFEAAGRPDDATLEFFRKAEAGPIMRTLADVPEKDLPSLRKLIEKFVGKTKMGGIKG